MYILKKINRKKYNFELTYVNIFLMSRPIIKFIADFGPLLIFFIIYYNSENNLKIAIPPFVIATLIVLTITYLIEKKFQWYH